MGFISIAGLAFLITSCLSCQPVPYFWDKDITTNGKCIDIMAFWFSFSAYNIITDMAVWLLPMPILKNLHLPRKQKYSLIGVFALGGL
jgi:hypothetical protein